MGKKKSGFLKEFKEFAMKGNMLDLAVGVIVGGAFKTVVDALTNSVIMPVVSMFLGGLSFEEWKIRLPQFFGENRKLPAFRRLPVRVHQLRHHGFCRVPDRQDRQSPA